MAHLIRITRIGGLCLLIEDEHSIHTIPLDGCPAIRIRGADGETAYSLEDLPLEFNIADLRFVSDDLTGRLAIHSSRTDRLLYCWRLKASPMTDAQRLFLLELMDHFEQADIPLLFKTIAHETVHDVEEYERQFSHQVDIAQLRYRLQEGAYESVQHFRSDFYRIEKHSALWSPFNSSMKIAAKELNAAFEKEMDKFLASPPQDGDTPSSHTNQGSQSFTLAFRPHPSLGL